MHAEQKLQRLGQELRDTRANSSTGGVDGKWDNDGHVILPPQKAQIYKSVKSEESMDAIIICLPAISPSLTF